MQPTDFSTTASGRIIRTAFDYWAFIPNPLPPTLEPTWGLAADISNADRALSELAGLARTLPNPHLLIAPFVRREALLSSRIEGTQASLSELFVFEAAPEHTQIANSDVQEVANYVVALEYGLERIKTFPISVRLIRELHERLMHGTRGQEQTPGEFRRTQNWIGAPGCTLNEATYVPPPVTEMMECLYQFEHFLHQPSDYPPLLTLALIHYQFEAIHPFLDGNGRVGRLLLTLLTCAQQLLPAPFLYLSAYFEKYRQDYYRLLMGVSRNGDWQPWIQFFLRGVADQSHDAIRRTHQLLALRDEYQQRIRTARASALLPRLVDALFESPALTVTAAAKLLDVTYVSAQKCMDRLVKVGILQEVTGQQRGRIYFASQIASTTEGL